MKTFNYTTHSKQVLGDMHTPVSIYLKVRDMYPQSALMESSDYHAGENSLSFIALCPLANIGVNSGIVTANYPDNSRTEEPLTKTFTVEKAMNRFINQFQVTGENKNVCGLYGYTTFNAVKYFEHIPVKESHDEQNDAPDLLYIRDKVTTKKRNAERYSDRIELQGFQSCFRLFVKPSQSPLKPNQDAATLLVRNHARKGDKRTRIAKQGVKD